MPLVNAKCTNCGAPLIVDNTKEAAICQYCGSAFIVEQAINNYNYYVTNNINADKVIITGKGDAEKERLLKNAETYERFKDYDKATQTYRQITEDYPNDYRGWLGLSLILSEDFNKIDLSTKEFSKLSSYMEKVLLCAPKPDQQNLNNKWNTYLNKRTAYINLQKKRLAELYSKEKEINNSIKNSNRIITDLNASSNSSEINKKSSVVDTLGVLLLGIILIILGSMSSVILIIFGVIAIIISICSFFYKDNKKKQIGKKKIELKNRIENEKIKLKKLNEEKTMIENETKYIKSII